MFFVKNNILVSGALHHTWPFCEYKLRLNNGNHVKSYIEFQKNRPFLGKKSLGVKGLIWDSFQCKNEKIVCKRQNRLARMP